MPLPDSAQTVPDFDWRLDDSGPVARAHFDNRGAAHVGGRGRDRPDLVDRSALLRICRSTE